jgi:hypothetical protein
MAEEKIPHELSFVSEEDNEETRDYVYQHVQ